MSERIERIEKIDKLLTEEVSQTFCLAKWHHTTIYLHRGQTHSCYHPKPHDIPLQELKYDPSVLHNTPEKIDERIQMFNGDKPSGCQYCWNVEELDEGKGPDEEKHVSDRHQRNSSIYTEDRLNEILFNPPDYKINPEYVEIAFSNECNFKCGYCHPMHSSLYRQEIKKHGPYNMVSNHQADIDWFDIYEEETNPYLDAFWKWWPELSKELTILRITGGEPTIQKSTYKLFDLLEQDPKPNLELNVNSNLGGKPKQLEKFTDGVNSLLSQNKIRRFKLFTSIDTWGERAEYIRDGLDIEVFERNLDYFMRNTDAPVTIMITFNIFSVTTFQTLLEKILEWRRKYNDVETFRWNRLSFDTPYLKEPLQYDINILPKDYMSYMHSHLQFIKDNLDDERKDAFTTMEYERFRRVVDYMDSTHYDPARIMQGRIDFHKFFQEQNRRRSVNHKQVFPEMSDFFKLCQELAE